MITKIIVLLLYLLILLAIGVYTSKKANSYDGFNLAGRGNNKWIGRRFDRVCFYIGSGMLLAMPGLAYAGGFQWLDRTGWRAAV